MVYDFFQQISFKRTFANYGSCQNAETQTKSYLLLLINNIFVMPFRHMLLDIPANSQMITPISYNIQHSPGVTLLQNPLISVFRKIKGVFLPRNCLKLETPFKNNCKSNYLKLNLELVGGQSCLKYLNESDKILSIMSLKSIFPNTSLQGCSAEKSNTRQEDVILQVSSPLKKSTQNLFAWFVGFTTTTPFSSKMCNETSENPKKQENVGVVNQNSGTTESYMENNVQSKTLCSHPIFLGVSRRRTSSEHSDDICFLEEKSSTLPNFDDESSDDDDYSSGDSDQEYCTFGYDDNHDVSEDDDEEYNSNYKIQKESLNSASEKSIRNNENTSNKKIVRFNLTPEVHTMYVWSFAYRSARKGHWESYARDRDRFRKRIQRASIYLNPILSCEHRSFIYKNRFANDM